MSIAAVTKLVPPPARPSEVGSIEQWRAVEEQLGLVLPSDYREFIFNYGSGLFANFFRIYNPFAKNKWTALYPSVVRVCGWQRELRQTWPKDVPYEIYPTPSGILPWGNDENGNNYFWIAKGSPDAWTVLSDEVRGEGFREYGYTITEYLTKVLLKECDALAGGYPTEKDRVFKAW